MTTRRSLDFAGLRALVLQARDSEDPASQEAAFNQLVLALQDFAVGSAYASVKDASLAEDIAQESFLVAWRQLHTLRNPAVFLGWFKRIIVTQCHRVLRKKGPDFATLAEDAAFAAAGLEEVLSRSERESLVREAVGHLRFPERLAIVLFYFLGRSHGAIATFLGVPRTTVIKRLFSARRRLKAALGPLQATVERSRPSRNREFAMMVRAGIYDDYVGLYRFDRRPELTVRVERVGNRLISLSAGQKNRVMLGTRLSELRTREFDGRARFVRGRSGRVTHFVYYEFGRRMGIASKIK